MSTESKAEGAPRGAKSKSSGKRYSAEFRREALRLIDGGRGQAKVAAELGVSVGTLRDWRTKAEVRASRGAPAGAAGESVTAENDRLKRELRVLRMELELAKKAAAFFARQTT